MQLEEGEKDPVVFDLLDLKYGELHWIATSGGSEVTLNVTLDYATGDPGVASITVPDWYDNDLDPYVYLLADGLDRAPVDAIICEEADDPALFGVVVPVDSTRVLESAQIERANESGTLSVLGVTGIEVDRVVFADGFDTGAKSAWSATTP